ncbi:hypothetical protein Pla175_30340 [Pirellulimonas nuda]|uniref:Uncharacterized protein n=1 Tax=Pirellulimonas nuda TaxID=2528009 RepID=A0A518DDT4_9BACT|nr:hypothetical protein Pla175_30340 [Pirellulimonas nuda]
MHCGGFIFFSRQPCPAPKPVLLSSLCCFQAWESGPIDRVRLSLPPTRVDRRPFVVWVAAWRRCATRYRSRSPPSLRLSWARQRPRRVLKKAHGPNPRKDDKIRYLVAPAQLRALRSTPIKHDKWPSLNVFACKVTSFRCKLGPKSSGDPAEPYAPRPRGNTSAIVQEITRVHSGGSVQPFLLERAARRPSTLCRPDRRKPLDARRLGSPPQNAAASGTHCRG